MEVTKTDFSNTLIRCSALGYIMTEPRGKTAEEKYNDIVEELRIEQEKYDAMANKTLKTAIKKAEKIRNMQLERIELFKQKHEIILSDTCKSYLIQSYVLSKYGRVREVQTKQTVKGTISEQDAVLLFAAMDKRPYTKNTQRIQNSYISGTPDLYDGETLQTSNEIIDIKSCWDIFTFLQNVDDPHNGLYYWQLQGYMALTGAKIGTIAYCLVNTPDSIVEGEKYNLLRRMDVATELDPDYQRELVKLVANRIYDDIPMQDRLLTYSIERNDDDIWKMYKKIKKCREFLADFEEQHLMFSKKYRKQLILEMAG